MGSENRAVPAKGQGEGRWLRQIISSGTTGNGFSSARRLTHRWRQRWGERARRHWFRNTGKLATDQSSGAFQAVAKAVQGKKKRLAVMWLNRQ